MVKMNLPDPCGKCSTCGINLYPPNNKPVKMPCNIGRFRDKNLKPEDRKACPFETAEQQNKQDVFNPEDAIAGLLGTQHGDG